MRRWISAVMVVIFSFLVVGVSFSETCGTKKDLMNQLSQARKDFMKQRDDLHDQNRLLRINWHKERADLYARAKENPADKEVIAKLNQGPKDFIENKRRIYKELANLRKEWLKTRADLGKKIQEAEI